MKPTIMYISTNGLWSGSEELWFESAKKLEEENYAVCFATKYSHKNLQAVKGLYINYVKPDSSRIRRILRKITVNKFNSKTSLEKFIDENKPGLVIISQGNNIDSLDVMRMCSIKNILFITITQLVSEVHLLWMTQQRLVELQVLYKKALINFFVSHRNLNLHNLMLGTELCNSEVIHNPCRVFGEEAVAYPDVKNNYQIGLVGRIECFHKGYDLLLQVLDQPKWRKRNVQFNIYGDGPHEKLMEDNISRLQLSNIVLKGFAENIRGIWENNHILLMPSRMEGQALSLIEAMYYARAAIVTDVGGAAELITDKVNGFVAKAPTIEYLDEALENAWVQRDNWEKMGLISRDLIFGIYKVPAEHKLNLRIKECLQEKRKD